MYDETGFLGRRDLRCRQIKDFCRQTADEAGGRAADEPHAAGGCAARNSSRNIEWDSTSKRQVANRCRLWSNAEFRVVVGGDLAMLTLKQSARSPGEALGDDVEESLMSGGVIILITAAGGAFGAMLQRHEHQRHDQRSIFRGNGDPGVGLLLAGLGYGRGVESRPGKQHGRHDHRRRHDVSDHWRCKT